MPQSLIMDEHILDAEDTTCEESGVILNTEGETEDTGTKTVQSALAQNGISIKISNVSTVSSLQATSESSGLIDLSEDDSSDSMDTGDQSNTYIQTGINNYIIVVSNSNKQEDDQNPETSNRQINATIEKILRILPRNETTSYEGQSKRTIGTQTRISMPDQPKVETRVLAEMQREGCFARINRFFQQLVAGIYDGSIIIDLSPDSVGSLHRLLQVVRSGELDTLILEIIQRNEILESVEGTELKIIVEILVPEDVFLDSGLTLADLGDLQISGHPPASVVKDLEDKGTGAVTIREDQLTQMEPDMLHKGNKAINIIIIGKSGCGKSSLGNIITGTESFLSELSGTPVTQSCKTVSLLRDDLSLLVTDTPGADGHEGSYHHTLVTGELRNLLKSLSGPTIFILTCRIGRWKEDELALMFYKELFGPHLGQNMIVVFMGKEDLDRHGTSLEEYLGSSPVSLQQLLAEVGRRVLTVSKRAPNDEKEEFVKKLMTTVKMLKDGGGDMYYWPIMEEAASMAEQKQIAATELKTTQKEKEEAAIEENVLEKLQQKMRTQLQTRDLKEVKTGLHDLQDVELDTLRRTDRQEDASSAGPTSAKVLRST